MNKIHGCRWAQCALAGAVLLGVASFVRAVVLVPGGCVALFGTTVAARPELAGVNQQDDLLPFTITDLQGNVCSGNLQCRVVRSDADGSIHFYFRIRDLDPNCCIVQVSWSGFDSSSTDVDYRLDGLGMVGPDNADRSTDGDTIDFYFQSQCVGGGSESYFVFVETTATNYDPAGGNITLYLSDGSSVTLPCAAPL